MILPNADAADVSKDKIVKYLLSTTHPSGVSKAAFFGRFGFTAAKWQELAAALQLHARENPVRHWKNTRYGVRYVVDGLLKAPEGSRLNVRSVWFISRHEEMPRFVTAHPLKRIAA
jgi:hypothetical protein